jgi:hypothetical protein
MSNVLKVEIEREFSDEFMQSLFNLCDVGIEYWATLDEDAGGTEYYDDEQKIIIAINIFETEDRTCPTKSATNPNRKVERVGDRWVTKWQINGSTFMKGIERIMTGDVEVRQDLFMNVCRAVVASDDFYLDTQTVDVIVQAGLYNELVWG